MVEDKVRVIQKALIKHKEHPDVKKALRDKRRAWFSSKGYSPRYAGPKITDQDYYELAQEIYYQPIRYQNLCVTLSLPGSPLHQQ